MVPDPNSAAVTARRAWVVVVMGAPSLEPLGHRTTPETILRHSRIWRNDFRAIRADEPAFLCGVGGQGKVSGKRSREFPRLEGAGGAEVTTR